MNSQIKWSLMALLALLVGIVGLANLAAKDPDAKSEPADGANAVKPKALSDNVKKGLAYLVSQQHDDGGWGQGGGWRQDGKAGGGRIEGKDVQDPSDVANTCLSTLALLRTGNTPKEGEYSKNVVKALAFLFGKIDKADKESLYVTDVRNTQIQVKIGPYADTFLAALVLAEMKGKMPDEKSEKQLITALDKTVNKIEINQKADGTFANNQGWASVLSQGLASKGLNRAAQAGAKVSKEALEKDQQQALAGFDKKTGEFRAAAATPPPAAVPAVAAAPPPAGIPAAGAGAVAKPPAPGTPVASSAVPTSPAGGAGAAYSSTRPSDAGVPLYGSSSSNASVQEAVNTLRQNEKKNREIVDDKSGAPKEAKAAAQRDLDRLKVASEANGKAVQALQSNLGNKQFVQGFGNNGGEEFLSYLNTSETLLVKGGTEWEKWDKQMTEGLTKAQDKDGGWSGQHCITGRTFCTSAALLVLMADRAPIPVAAKVKTGK